MPLPRSRKIFPLWVPGGNFIFTLPSRVGTSTVLPMPFYKTDVKASKILMVTEKEQLVCVHVWTPQQLTKEEKLKLESLKNSSNFTPKAQKQEKGFFEKVEFF